ncbi:MAG: divalent-cation tolerance protein CutA [Acidobacteria bacterium]|nr:MAG: divalent-cation tolerance protein CutA [Acidobacteriota bacterium]
MSKMLVVFTTVPNKEEGETLARKIVEQRLGACVQVLPQMTSFYFWQGEIQKDSEHLILIKTLPEKYKDLQDFIIKNHSYSVPEIIALSVQDAFQGYLEWAKDYLL